MKLAELCEGKNEKINGWEIVDKSFVSKGSDPTQVTKIILTKGEKKIEIGEFFGDWSLIDGDFKSKKDLKTAELDKLLKERGAPTLKQIGHKLSAGSSLPNHDDGIYGEP